MELLKKKLQMINLSGKVFISRMNKDSVFHTIKAPSTLGIGEIFLKVLEGIRKTPQLISYLKD